LAPKRFVLYRFDIVTVTIWWSPNLTDEELLAALDEMRTTMIAVSTGGPRIGEVNSNFQERYREVGVELGRRGLLNPLPYGDLWKWYGRWTSGDLPTYRSRREFIAQVFDPLVIQIQTKGIRGIEETGWNKVDRQVGRCRDLIAAAQHEEDFQAVGLICREATISLAQAVWISALHPTIDGVLPSTTDGKRMLDAYINVELGGGVHEAARKHVKSSLELAISLQHKRTAGFRDAALCLEATTSVVNVIAIIAGRRDPS
jgi:hypothetical protein